MEAVDVATDGVPGLGPCLEDGAPDELGFQRLEKRLGERIEAPIFVKARMTGLPACRDGDRSPARCIV